MVPSLYCMAAGSFFGRSPHSTGGCLCTYRQLEQELAAAGQYAAEQG